MKLIILCFYINIDGKTLQFIDEQFHQMIEHYRFSVDGYHIECIWLPVTDQETKVECIYPNYVTLNDRDNKIKDVMCDISEQLKINPNNKINKHNNSILRFFKLKRIFR